MKLPKMIENNFEPHFALKHMLKDMKLASQLGLSHHLELAVTTAARDRLLEQEQRGFTEEDFSVIARKYFPEVQWPAVEQDLELFEPPPPIEPAATISTMGEVAAAGQPDVDLAPPPAETPPQPEMPLQQPEPVAEQPAPVEQATPQPSAPAPADVTPNAPPAEPAPQEAAAEKPSEQPEPSKGPMDMLAKMLRGESISSDKS
jgi:hypothetical protein